MAKSKSKKRKLNDPQQYNQSNNQISKYTANNGNLTHEEIWDDSALLRSWDDAVAEYEFYHSIHAKGEDVDEVLKEYHARNEHVADGKADDVEEGEVDPDGADEEGEIVEEDEVDKLHSEGGHGVTFNAHAKTSLQATSDETNDESTSKSAPISLPQPNGGTSVQSQPQNEGQDQILENVKMAYYWAGYYSGLYDGQRQSQIPASTQIETKLASNTAGDTAPAVTGPSEA